MGPIFNFRFSIFDSRPYARLALAAAASGLLSPTAAAAQGCVMCYQSASAAKQAGIQALANGVLILLIPPLVMAAAIVWRTYRASQRDAAEMDSESGLRGIDLTSS